MKYGYFDDANREYVITTPKTPLPWINYLAAMISSHSYRIPAADTASTRTQNFCV